MRRRTKLAVVAGGATAAIAGGAILRGRLGGRGSEALPPDDDAMFTVFAPGGRYGFLANGPVGWVIAKLMPVGEAGVYQFAAEMIDLQPDDELLDIGCGPGAFLAAKAQHVRRVVGLDLSRVMLREAERRLADRIAAGTARLVTGSAAELPFEDGEFSAVTAIFAPVKHAEAFRVLRPGGRLVFSDPDPRRSPSEPASAWGRRRCDEADHRRMFEDAGFTDVTLRYRGAPPLAGELFVSGRKPAAS
jgi:ubiquinone/menaquinone biosynthesis C-methylase UbiE